MYYAVGVLLHTAAFLTQTICLDDTVVKFEIWDTAGQERYHSLAPMYYRGAQAAIVMYDITNKVQLIVCWAFVIPTGMWGYLRRGLMQGDETLPYGRPVWVAGHLLFWKLFCNGYLRYGLMQGDEILPYGRPGWVAGHLPFWETLAQGLAPKPKSEKFGNSLLVLCQMMRWRCWQGNRLVIHSLQVRVLARYQCIVALGKLLTPVASVTEQYNLVLVKGGDLFGWASNRGPGGKYGFVTKSPAG